jgi:murein DD-endopeptidase MepM/ murein hydrolase activator NlpD
MGNKHYQALQNVRVRSKPRLIESARTGHMILRGQVVMQRGYAEADGYKWIRHELGWSAQQKIGGQFAYLYKLNICKHVPDVHFSQLPLPLDVTQWFYYYGNTAFAYLHGRKHNYDGYSQGLHGGLDFGHPGGAPIYAGVNGILDYAGSGRAFGPNRVDVIAGKYRIIYGHVARPTSLPIGAHVEPDAVIGQISHTQQHLHLEIRYKQEVYILNPLLFMPDFLEAISGRFPATANARFYCYRGWDHWCGPLEQPTIVRGGPVIGPTLK